MAKTRRRTGNSRRSPNVAPAPRDGADLCLSCGLCCDGSLFSNGLLIGDEVDLARSLGMAVLRSSGGTGSFKFGQPCSCFRDGCCAVYDQEKPSVCTTYRCELLEGYSAGTIDLESCRDVIGWMQGLTHELEVEMELAFATFTHAQLVTYARTVRPHEEPERYARFMDACDRYLDLGTRFFRFPNTDLATIIAELDEVPVPPTVTRMR
jgi:hypothetical protein